MDDNNDYYLPNDDLDDSMKKKDEWEEDNLTNGDGLSNGENYPSYAEIHIKLIINRERTDMIQKLIQADMPPITSDDGIDWLIDCEIYNAECRRTMLYTPIKITKKTENM
jgi:hypothetical protein